MAYFNTFAFYLKFVIFIMEFNVATFEQLQNWPSRGFTLLDLTLEAGVPGNVMRLREEERGTGEHRRFEIQQIVGVSNMVQVSK